MKAALKTIAITVVSGIILIAAYEGYKAMQEKKAAKRKTEPAPGAATPAAPATK